MAGGLTALSLVLVGCTGGGGGTDDGTVEAGDLPPIVAADAGVTASEAADAPVAAAEDAPVAAHVAPASDAAADTELATAETFAPSVAACGPAGTVATPASAGGVASGSLFDVASVGDAATGEAGRIDVAPARRRGIFRFGNPNTAPRSRGTTGKRRIVFKPGALAGTWRLAEGTPGCGCTVTLDEGDGGLNPARASGCAASGLDRLTGWRVRGSEIVLLANDRTLLGALYSDDGQEFRGGLSNGTRAILWR